MTAWFKKIGILTAFGLASTLLAPAAQARDLHGRFGLGYNNEWAVNAPGISFKYFFTKGIAAALTAGVATTSPASLAAGGKFFANIFYETDLNFYFMCGGAVVSNAGLTGADILAGLGVEFFFPGLESLGFSLELGAALSNVTGGFVFRTLGVSPLNAGIHFYF